MDESREWLQKAERDYRTAKVNFEQKIYDAAAFFCQQAAEKGLKAVYIKKFRVLMKTHDLNFLGGKLKLSRVLREACDELNSYYAETRYPDVQAEFDRETAAHAIEKAGKVLLWVNEKLL